MTFESAHIAREGEEHADAAIEIIFDPSEVNQHGDTQSEASTIVSSLPDHIFDSKSP